MNYNNSVIYSIYKKKFLINNIIQFKSGYHEDILFFFKVFFTAKLKFIYNENLYIKYDTKNSIVNTFSLYHIKNTMFLSHSI